MHRNVLFFTSELIYCMLGLPQVTLSFTGPQFCLAGGRLDLDSIVFMCHCLYVVATVQDTHSTSLQLSFATEGASSQGVQVPRGVTG